MYTVVYMLAFDDLGDGPPLVLIHGTPSSRREWTAVLPALTRQRRVIALDLPGFGESAPVDRAVLPRDWVPLIAATLDHLGLERVSVVGSSMGGWTALELARAGRARAVLAFSPAGLWRRHPLRTDLRILQGQLFGRIAPRSAFERVMADPDRRRRALKNISVDAGKVPSEVLTASLADVLSAPGWWPHYRAARRNRFTGGDAIDPGVPVRIVFGQQDRMAPAKTSQFSDHLPAHATVETWPDCGHMVIWDAESRAVTAMLQLP
jgi:pimeloyl-ACP methyl ester carboxylesterase